MGNGSVLRPGEVQRMSAGTGVSHSEFNHCRDGAGALPADLDPAGPAGATSRATSRSSFPPRRVAAGCCSSPIRAGTDGAVTVHQDVRLYAADLEAGQSLSYAPPAGRHTWLQVARGLVELNGDELRAGDGAAISNEPQIELASSAGAEVLLFDLA